MLSGDTYQLSAYSAKLLFDDYATLKWSEEIFNCYIALLNQKTSSYYIFDTLTASAMLARVADLDLLHKSFASKTHEHFILPILC